MRETCRFADLAELVDAARIESGDVDSGAEALTDGTESLTWAEYADRVARLAGALAVAGVGRGDRVGVRLAKSVSSFVAVHGIVRAGGVVVSIDASAPTDHAGAVLADADIAVLIADTQPRGLIDIVVAAGITTVVLPRRDADAGLDVPDGVEVVWRDQIAATVPLERVALEPTDPAYIIYTSGSTGRPKGIVHSHASGLAYADQAASTYGLTTADRLANIAPLHFDQSTFELFAAPLAGAAVLVVPDPVLRFPASLSEMIADQRISVWYSVPYLLEQLSTRGVLAERDLSALRWVLFGGESFPPGQLAALMEQLPAAEFSNVYGPAEVNQCTVFNLAEPPDGDRPIPIGAAWPAAELMLIDPDGDPSNSAAEAQPGAPGELLVASATMMSHYWNRPDLTAMAIIERADADGRARRWYRTGDLVLGRDDGELVFVGRVDNQIKLRGHRIELEAVDAVLGDVDGVSESTCVVVRPADGDDRLLALVVPVDLSDDDVVSRTLTACRTRLPRYAVPADVVLVATLPRTSTDKVDRNASLAAHIETLDPAAFS